MCETDDARPRRVCFTLHVKPERIDDYKARHREVWPEMARALKESGWHNYSLFLSESGLMIGYLETDDFDAALEAMAKTEVNSRWQESMTDYFEHPGDSVSDKADENMRPIPLVFHLEDRLAELAGSAT
ncbi:L-rhamnose mutarotase [Spelaeicoccus albus]|uniref:L-rhamnose mutarotase n=1 Tax=Spelaeicoccus albus TaxID=1280376 RepID=A0A7Z0CZX6_9MICO|nr:L-rhamnose mutarotase [Spelaeicoccus albus]NYI66776.1 L-rhamnose mutarotase [Spelaeicoccus albus]